MYFIQHRFLLLTLHVCHGFCDRLSSLHVCMQTVNMNCKITGHMANERVSQQGHINNSRADQKRYLSLPPHCPVLSFFQKSETRDISWAISMTVGLCFCPFGLFSRVHTNYIIQMSHLVKAASSKASCLKQPLHADHGYLLSIQRCPLFICPGEEPGES